MALFEFWLWSTTASRFLSHKKPMLIGSKRCFSKLTVLPRATREDSIGQPEIARQNARFGQAFTATHLIKIAAGPVR